MYIGIIYFAIRVLVVIYDSKFSLSLEIHAAIPIPAANFHANTYNILHGHYQVMRM
jgi:hypothetical protein